LCQILTKRETDLVACHVINDAPIVGGSTFFTGQRQQVRKTCWQKEVVSIQCCDKIAARRGEPEIAGMMATGSYASG